MIVRAHRHGFSTLLAAAALLLVAPGPAAGQEAAQAAAKDEALPSADEVIARYVEALGGEDAIRSPKSLSLKGRVEVPAMKLEGEIEHRSAAPDRYVLDYSVPGLGAQREGYTGEVGWRLEDGVYPRLTEGRELKKMVRSADFYPELNYAKHFPTREMLGVAEFNGETCYKLRLATDYDDEIVEYFDTDTGLMVGRESWSGPVADRIQVIETILDYRKVGKRLFPVKVSQQFAGVEQTIEWTDIVVDRLEDGELAPPKDVAELMKQGGSQGGDDD